MTDVYQGQQGSDAPPEVTSPTPENPAPATNGRTKFDSALERLPPDVEPPGSDASLKFTVRPSDKYDKAIEALDTNQLLEENPGWSGTTKEAFRMLGQGGLRGLAMDIGMPVDTMNMVGDFIRDHPGAANNLVGSMPGLAGPAMISGAARNIATGGESIETGSTPDVRKRMERAGLSTKSSKEEGLTGSAAHWMSEIGEFAGANAPFAFLTPVRAGAGAVPGIIDAATSTKGAGALLKELGIGGAVPGSGSVILQEAAGPDYEDEAKMIGGLARTLQFKMLSTAYERSKNLASWMHDFMGFGTGGKKIAGATLASTTQDLPAARQALSGTAELSPGVDVPLQRPDGRVLPTNLPVPIQSGDIGTIAFAQNVAKRDALFAGDMQAAQHSIEDALIVDTKLARGNFPDTESWLTARQDMLEQLAGKRIRQAVDEAERATETAFSGVEILPSEATAAKATQATIMRAELLNAQDDFRAVVDAKWANVDKSLPVNVDPVYDRLRTLQSEHEARPGRDTSSFPKEQFAKFFDEAGDARFGSQTSLETVIDLDSAVQREIRRLQDPLQGAQDPVKISYLKRLSESLNEAKYSIAESGQSPEQVAVLKDAVNATKTFHDTFSRGPVGQVLGLDRAGGVDIPSGNTIKQFLSQGPGGIDAFKSFMKAAGARTGQVAPIHSEAGMVELMSKYLRQDFYDKVMPNGQFNQRAAQQWMSNNAGPMQHPSFAGMRKELDAAIQSQGTASQMREFEKQTTEQVRQNAAALFLKEPGRLFNSALDAPDKYKATRELIEMTKGDPTGRATEGVAQMAFDRMLADGLVADMTSTRLQRINGVNVLNWVEANRGTIRALDEAVPGIRDRFNRIAETAKYLESFQISTKMPPPEAKMTGGLIRQLIARVAGARVFSKFAEGGASIQTAAIGSQAFKLIANSVTPDQATDLLRKAMFNKRLFEDLTKDWSQASPQKQAAAIIRLQPHLYSVGIPIVQPYLNPPNQPRERTQPTRSSAGPSDWPSLGVP